MAFGRPGTDGGVFSITGCIFYVGVGRKSEMCSVKYAFRVGIVYGGSIIVSDEAYIERCKYYLLQPSRPLLVGLLVVLSVYYQRCLDSKELGWKQDTQYKVPGDTYLQPCI